MTSWKSISAACAALTVSFGLTACGNVHPTKPITAQATVKNKAKGDWKVVNQVPWSKEYSGLKITIERVAVNPVVENIEFADKMTPAIRIEFKLKDSSPKYKFEIHPEDAILFTSTGEEYKSSAAMSDTFKGKTSNSELRDGKVGYYLNEGTDVKDLKWIKLNFKVTRYSSIDAREKHINTGKIYLNKK